MHSHILPFSFILGRTCLISMNGAVTVMAIISFHFSSGYWSIGHTYWIPGNTREREKKKKKKLYIYIHTNGKKKLCNLNIGINWKPLNILAWCFAQLTSVRWVNAIFAHAVYASWRWVCFYTFFAKHFTVPVVVDFATFRSLFGKWRNRKACFWGLKLVLEQCPD